MIVIIRIINTIVLVIMIVTDVCSQPVAMSSASTQRPSWPPASQSRLIIHVCMCSLICMLYVQLKFYVCTYVVEQAYYLCLYVCLICMLYSYVCICSFKNMCLLFVRVNSHVHILVYQYHHTCICILLFVRCNSYVHHHYYHHHYHHKNYHTRQEFIHHHQ